MLRTASSLPLAGLLTLGSDPARFQTETASLLPGLLAATRTGLSPAGDDELTNSKIRCYVTASPPALLGARKRFSVPVTEGPGHWVPVAGIIRPAPGQGAAASTGVRASGP